MPYRPEIDGLRALAVIPVIFFHAGFETFSGGYIGVDVFFVISGYLITSIIIREMEQGKFSLIHFYERRARRILPALFFVMFVCTPFAWLLLAPADMERFTTSTAAAGTFWSNIFFWRESGYFAPAADTNPLLHTWSLSVEEQYYILFPLFLMAAWRFGRRTVAVTLLVVFAVSLGLAEMNVRIRPGTVFYLLPTRGWEILLGVFCALWLGGRKEGARIPAASWPAAAGLVMIAASVFLFDEETPSPGLVTLIPACGAALFILSAHNAGAVKALMASRPMVGLGLISYSLYLWHQPVFAFAGHAETRYGFALDSVSFLLMAPLIFCLAVFSWRYVEVPFRDPSVPKLFGGGGGGGGLVCAALAVLAAIALGAAGRATGGFEDLIVKYRMNADQRAFYALVRQNRLADQRIINPAAAPCYMRVESRADIDAEKINACRAEYGQALLILGDSHAMDLSRIIAETGVFPFLIDTATPGCQPPRGVEFCGWGSVDALVRDFGGAAGAVFFHQSGSRFIEDKNGRVDSQAAFEGAYGGVRLSDIKSLMTWLEDLRRKFAAPVVWVGPFAEYRYTPFAAVYDSDKRRFNPASKPLFRELELEIEKAVAAAGFEIYAGFEKLFTVPENILAEDCFMFDDEDHFSACGERIIARTETGQLRAFRDNLGVFPPHP